MKKIFLLTMFWSMTISLMSQSLTLHDPLVQNANVWLNEGQKKGELSFQFIQKISDYANQKMPIRMVVSLENVKPTNGVASISGTFSHKFNWQYDETLNYFLATQKEILKQDELVTITIAVDLLQIPSCYDNQQVGLNVNIQPAACMNGINNLSNDNVSIFTCESTLTTSLNTLPSDSYSIYPNPVSQFIQLDFIENMTDVKLEILDMSKKIVQKYQFDQIQYKQIDLANLTSGSYYLIIKTDKKIATEKLVIID